MDELTQRVLALERKSRRQQLVASALLLLLVCWATMGQNPTDPALPTIRGRSFEVVDDAGVARARLGLPEQGPPALVLLDPQGEVFWRTPEPGQASPKADTDARSVFRIAFTIDETSPSEGEGTALPQASRLFEDLLATKLSSLGFQVHRHEEVSRDQRQSAIQKLVEQDQAHRYVVVTGNVTLSTRTLPRPHVLHLLARTTLSLRDARSGEALDLLDTTPMIVKAFASDLEVARQHLSRSPGMMQLARYLALQLHALHEDDPHLEGHYREMETTLIEQIRRGRPADEAKQDVAEDLDLLELRQAYQVLLRRRK